MNKVFSVVFVLVGMFPAAASAGVFSSAEDELRDAAIAGDTKEIKRLIRSEGADPDYVRSLDGGKEWRAIHFAATHCRAGSIKALIQEGASTKPPRRALLASQSKPTLKDLVLNRLDYLHDRLPPEDTWIDRNTRKDMLKFISRCEKTLRYLESRNDAYDEAKALFMLDTIATGVTEPKKVVEYGRRVATGFEKNPGAAVFTIMRDVAVGIHSRSAE